MQIEKINVLNVLEIIPSGIGLDVSKNHTGVVIWNGKDTEEYGFELQDYDKSDYFAEYKMRRDFKKNLSEIVKGRYFEICVIEDVYGGENFDTVRKLLALNTVIDELIFEHVCTVNEFYRWKEPTWISGLRLLYRQKGKLRSKVETQGILEYLEYKFYLENKDLKESEKKKIYFEDICDACGMLLGVVAKKELESKRLNSKRLTLSQIKMLYLEHDYDNVTSRNKVISNVLCMEVELDLRHLEKSIIA